MAITKEYFTDLSTTTIYLYMIRKIINAKSGFETNILIPYKKKYYHF
jgi:hypothetical protein